MKKGFSLIELLIVVLIMGTIYSLAIAGFTKIADNQDRVTLLNLKKFLSELKYESSAKLLCIDDTSTCRVYIDNNVSEIYDEIFEEFLDDTVRAYKYDSYSGVVEVNFGLFYSEHGVAKDIFFEYEVNRRGVGEQYLIEYKNIVYDYSNYLSNPKIYKTVEEAQDARDILVREILD